ncbi:uncharacterized protein [Argopecten irradians]|uniref:uncharacterized protein n=1 Tax=Argopecten irradians TaxID=31199 RepID=UPI00372069A7
MDIRLSIILVVMLSAIHQGPATYTDLMCVEHETGFAEKLFHYFAGTEIERRCPRQADVLWRMVNEVLCNIFCILTTLLLGHAPLIKKKWAIMATKFQKWRTRPRFCRHCGTIPCQVKRRSLWKPSGSRKRDEANLKERSKAMRLFHYGLELSVVLTKELPPDDHYWQRKFCDKFEEEHMVLFPLCIQRQINEWYPLPR